MADAKQSEPTRQYLAFDHYQRYRLVTDVVRLACEQAGEPLEGRTVLDLGGVQGFARTFLPPSVSITTGNLRPSPHDRAAGPNDHYVITGEGALPFDDRAFDFVVACDVLEHVPSEQREGFLAEVARVAGHTAVILAPFDTPGVREAEALVCAVYESVFHAPYRWLEEHARLSLPDLKETVALFRRLFPASATMPSSYLPNWVLLMTVNVVLARHRHTAPVNEQLTDLYAALYYARDQREPAYRYALVGSKGSTGPDLSQLVSRRPAAKAALLPEPTAFAIAAVGAFRDLAEELARAQQALDRAVADRSAAQEMAIAQTAQAAAAVAERDQAQSRLAETEERATQMEQRATALGSEVTSLRSALDQAAARFRQAAAQRDEQQDEATALRSRLVAMEASRAATEQAEAAARRTLAELTRAHHRVVSALQELKEERDAAQGKLAELSARPGSGGKRAGR